MAQQVFRYFRELFNIQLSSYETIFLLSNAKLLYTSSKVYKEAGVAVVAVADVVRFNCRELVDLRRRRVQKVGCRKNTACIEKKNSQFPKMRRARFFIWRENSNRNLPVGGNWRYSID